MLPRSTARRACCVALFASAATTGCYSWQVQPVVPREYVAAHPGKSIQIERINGQSDVFDSAAIDNNTLTGFRGRGSIVIPLVQVRSVAESRFASGKTATVLGTVAAIGVGLFLLARATTHVP